MKLLTHAEQGAIYKRMLDAKFGETINADTAMLAQHIEALENQIKVCREALEWYRDRLKTWSSGRYLEAQDDYYYLDLDEGLKATEALEKLEDSGV